MKTITLNSINLSYFKGITTLSLHLNEGVSTISARNGAGKSTIADAFLWVLFDKDTAGRTKFRIRTVDAASNYIPNTRTFVELHLTVDNHSYNIRKELHAKAAPLGQQTSKELSSTAKFYINGQSYTKTDFSQFIRDNIITEDTLRIITSPTHFFSLPWEKQRTILITLVQQPDFATLNAEHKYDAIAQLIDTKQFADLAAINSHAAYNLKEIQKQLDLIPVQLQEQTSTMPPAQNWEALQATVTQSAQQLSELQAKRTELLNAPEDASRKHLRQQLEFQQKRIDDMRKSAYRMASETIDSHNNEVADVKRKLNEYKQNLLDLDSKFRSLTQQSAQIGNAIRESETEQQAIRKEWAERITIQFVPTTSETCSLCGQPLPLDKLNQIIEQQRQNFNLRKADARKELTARADKCKIMMIRANNEAQRLLQEIEITKGQQKAISGYISNQEKRLAELNRKNIPTADSLLSINPGYKDACKRIADLEADLSSQAVVTVDHQLLSDIDAQIQRITATLDDARIGLASKQSYDTHRQRIKELEQKQVSLSTQYSQWLHLHDLCHDYQLQSNEIVESRINALFNTVSFTLFRHLVNGNTEPFCEALVNGVPVITNVNHAAFINAGLEIINILSQQMQVSAPIFIDNAESIQHITPTFGQQIRLYVGDEQQITLLNK